jgi:hypothetical protein
MKRPVARLRDGLLHDDGGSDDARGQADAWPKLLDLLTASV